MNPLLPGSTIGYIGGGQLGRMMVLAGRRLGLRSVILDPDPGGPAGQVADRVVRGRLDDPDAVLELSALADVVTLETEHVPAAVLEPLAGRCRLHPGPAIMGVVQDRLRQREFLAGLGAPQVAWQGVDSLAALEAAVAALGTPCVLKTRREGYDGRGQARIGAMTDCAQAWAALGGQPAVLEAWAAYRCEVSVVLARSASGALEVWPLAENIHRRHILHMTVAPARVGPGVTQAAIALAGRIASALDHVGVMAVEFFVMADDSLLVNEIAPRVHNSGHYTEAACVTSQFEQHLRAICDLPLGSTEQLRPAVMLNLLGDLWAGGEPDWCEVLGQPAAMLQLYGKAQARPARKMGHIVITDTALADAMHSASVLHERLSVPAKVAPATA
ncbi:MAG: 5-(carboxyamino)imidazole ribonucleotide synthase [Chromatiales bacterium]|nr:5-(carboxyamino)imidazole ribonucleotide synthase [Chromatiales bacterium]